MGCWLQTCMVSRLHVFEKEEVVSLFLVEKTTRPPSFCESNALWEPIPIILRGKYEDSGVVAEVEDDPNNDLLFNYLYRFCNKPVGKELFETGNFDDLFEEDHDDGITIPGLLPNDIDRQVKHVVIKRDLFERIKATHVIDGYESDTSFKSLAKDMDGQVDTIIEWVLTQKYPIFDAQMMEISLRDQDKEIPPILRTLTFNRTAHFIAMTILQDLGDIEYAKLTLTLFLYNLAEFYILDSFISLTRTAWMPPVGMGSQSSDHEGYRLLIDYMAETLDREEKEWNE